MARIIYTLTDPAIPGAVRYVGVTNEYPGHLEASLRRRLNGHVRDRTGTPVSQWIETLAERGVKPCIEAIGVVEDEDAHVPRGPGRVPRASLELEEFWILALIRDGHPLLNRQCAGTPYRFKA